ncbi:MAG TPA: hypothetical protein VHV74_25480 [Pseudonocardiaceae bacterium]|jgi:hypothetical protein|nr:hypothetical protein [Pseudonocardiaceae bacterium]
MATITAAPRSIRARALEVPWSWAMLVGEAMLVACLLHLVLDVENLSGELQFAVFFCAVFPLQILLGTVRDVSKNVGITVLAIATVLTALYVYSRTTVVAQVPPPPGTAGINTVGTIVLGLELLAASGLGIMLPVGVRRWLVRSFLGIGIVFWLLWFWVMVANASA